MENRVTPSTRRVSRNPLAKHFSQYNEEGVVTETELINPTLRRIRISSERLAERSYTPGQHVRMQINDPLSLYGIFRPSQTLRTYTIWEYSSEGGYFDICVHLYGGKGIGLEWASTVQEGQGVVYWGPMGDFVVEAPEDYVLFVGEETASAAFVPMIKSLPRGLPVYVVSESDGPSHDVPLPGSVAIQRVHRAGESAASSSNLVSGLAGLELPDRPGRAYVAGEARTCQMVRDHLVNQRGWARTDVRTKPFWAPGKQGLH
ncbi:siderophore-interacting protein [Nocardiopsis valliformis]|uniref:siderophore-interacting protein n=1 Tax=Nocardiopsis valliformis TaxID=239974 RepID=UPI00034CF243|nr:siderophore-interacting protein [Nocardiopsis valliformis]